MEKLAWCMRRTAQNESTGRFSRNAVWEVGDLFAAHSERNDQTSKSQIPMDLAEAEAVGLHITTETLVVCLP